MNYLLPPTYSLFYCFFCASWILLLQTSDSNVLVFRFFQSDPVDLDLRVLYEDWLSPNAH